jgi:hypothetical protein
VLAPIAAFLTGCVVGALIFAFAVSRTPAEALPVQANASSASGTRDRGEAASAGDQSTHSSKRSELPASVPDETVSKPEKGIAKGPDDGHNQNHWLNCNAAGEPYEATLSDGTVLKIDTYGDAFEAYDSRPPIDVGREAETVVDYEKLKRSGMTFFAIQLDVPRRTMYWIEIAPASGQKLSSAGLDGEDLRTVVDIPFQNPVGLALDAENRKIYWTSNSLAPAFGKSADAQRAVWRANFDGSAPEAIFGGLESGHAVAVADRDIFYFDDSRLVRGARDGSGEKVLFAHAAGGRIYPGSWTAFDSDRGVLYWAGDGTDIAAIQQDGSQFRLVVELGLGFGHISGVALDAESQKLYWTERSYQEIWRANLDGSQPELIAVGLDFPRGIDVDSEHGYAYWTDWRHGTIGLIRRLKLPPVLTPRLQTAPPLISAITPLSQRPGLEITVRGANFANANRVRLIDDDGSCREATFLAKSDRELVVTVPAGGKAGMHAAILVQTPGGVAVTLPRTATVEHAESAFDRFRDAGKSPFVIAPGAYLDRIEHSVAYCPATSRATAGDRGGAVFFLKNGAISVIREAPGVVVYHEPFARIQRRAKASPDATFVAVPAIRPSFVSECFRYQAGE